MVELLERHKELFSGIGATAFALLVAFVVWLGKKVHGRLSKVPEPMFPGALPFEVRPLKLAFEEVSVSQLTAPSEPQPPFDAEIYLTRPLPIDIREQIDQAPPFHRDRRCQEHVGRKVQWRTKLKSMSFDPSEPDKVRVNLYHHSDYLRPPALCAVVEVERNPKLRDSIDGTIIWVAGEIVRCSPYVIEIGDAQLKIEL